MESLFHHHHGRQLDALFVTIKTRQLDRSFVGLTAGIAEKHFRHAGQGAQLVRQRFLAAHAVQIRGMNQATGLVGNRRHQFRVRVTQGIDRNAGNSVEIFAPFGIGEAAPLTLAESHRQASVGIHDM